MGLSHVGLGTEGGEAVGFGVWAVRVRARTARGLAGPAPGRSPRITRSTIGWRQHRRMAEPSAFIVVDTSAAVEMLVTEAESRIRYMTLFDQLRAAGYGIASSDVLLPELLEAAYTWDVRRSGGRDWRRLRREGSLDRPRALELEIIERWDGYLEGWRSRVVPNAQVASHAKVLMAATGLSSLDAIHLATAVYLDTSIVSHDRGLLAVASRMDRAITTRIL